MVLASAYILSAQEAPATDSLKEYTGKYKFPEGSEVTEIKVAIENGILWAYSDKGSSELKKIEKDVFEVVQYTGKATFKRDDQGKIKLLHVVVGDLIMEGTKTEEPVFQQNSRLQRSPAK